MNISIRSFIHSFILFTITDVSGITPGFYVPGGSMQFAIAFFFGWGFNPKYPLPSGQGPPSNTICVIGPHKCTCQMASKFGARFKHGARM